MINWKEPDYIGDLGDGNTIYVTHSSVFNPGWKWLVLKDAAVMYDSGAKYFSSAQSAMRDVQAFLKEKQ